MALPTLTLAVVLRQEDTRTVFFVCFVPLYFMLLYLRVPDYANCKAHPAWGWHHLLENKTTYS